MIKIPTSSTFLWRQFYRWSVFLTNQNWEQNLDTSHAKQKIRVLGNTSKDIARQLKNACNIQWYQYGIYFYFQVNGAYDLPHVRLSGVSTPYVRVHLLPGTRDKEPKSNFLNLATNRICMFDQITLEEAQK